MKLHTISFGCQMNTADSEEMARALAQKGFTFTDSKESADAILINTCTVRQHAEDKAFSLVGTLAEWKEADPNRLLIIAGCAAERTKENLLKRFEHVDLVVGAKSIEQFPEIIDEALKERNLFSLTPHPTLCRRGDRGNLIAHVTTMRGCNYSCSYCIVPFVRGRESYRDPAAIEAEIRQRVQEGAKEVLFLGQTVNSFKWEGWNFAKLLRMAGGIEGVERIRFMSPHPYYMTDELIAAMAEAPAVCEHLHLPLQSGSDRMLELMQRNYTTEKYAGIASKLREAVPGISLTTDIIAGFPGETEEDFQKSLDFLKETGFDGAYCFKFSPREGTKAAQMEGQIPLETIEERHIRLLEVVETMSGARTKRYLGREMEVLFEQPGVGRTRTNNWVEVESGEALPGRLLNIQIEASTKRRLYGKVTISSHAVQKV